MTPEEIMKYLIDETRREVEENNGGPFGAAVVVDGEIVAIGVNGVYSQQDPTAHGEIVAIRKASKKLGVKFPENTVLYTTSQSCPMCVSAAMWAGIRKIYFGATSEFDDTIGMGDKELYSYLRGNENPEILEQKQIGASYAENMLHWFEKRNHK